MRVLVTGGTGYLGAAIVRALIAGGHTPVVFARRAAQAKVAGEAFDGDVRDGPAVLRAARNADAIVHTAALVSIWHRQPSTFDEVNVGGLEAVLAAARTLGIRRIVYTSSFLAHPPAGSQVPLRANDYQRTKVRAGGIAHEAIRAGLPIVSLVPGVVYGPGTQTEGNLIGRMVRDHLAGRLPGLVGADRCWSYAYVDDVAEAHVRALLPQIEPGEYVLGGDNQPQMRVFEIVREETGMPVPRRIPLPAAFAVACVEELRARVTGRLPSITRGVVEILRHNWSLDSARSIDKLNYRTRPLALGVRALLSAGS